MHDYQTQTAIDNHQFMIRYVDLNTVFVLKSL